MIKTPAGYLDFCFLSRQLHAFVSQCPVRVDLVWYFLCNRNWNQNLEEGYGSCSSWVKIIRFRRFRFRFRNTDISNVLQEVLYYPDTQGLSILYTYLHSPPPPAHKKYFFYADIYIYCSAFCIPWTILSFPGLWIWIRSNPECFACSDPNRH